MSKYISILIGLEEALWSHLSVSEKIIFRIVGVLFIINTFLLTLGMYVYSYLVFSSLPLTLLAGTFFAITLTGVMRFVLAVIKRSPAELQIGKILSFNPYASTDSVNEIEYTNNLANSGILKPTRYIEPSNIILVLMMFFLGSITAFPLCVLLDYENVKAFNKSLMDRNLEEWLVLNSSSFEKSRPFQQKKILDLQKEISLLQMNVAKSSYLDEKRITLDALLAREAEERSTFDDNLAKRYALYSAEMAGRYFLKAILVHVVSLDFFFTVVIVLILTFISPVILLIWLKSSSRFLYFKASAAMFRKSILEDYEILLAYKEEVLKRRQVNGFPKLTGTAVWLDPPFNSVNRFHKKKRTPVDVNELL